MTAGNAAAQTAPAAPQIVVVTGTGTDVGKTVATAALAAAYGSRRQVGICKPVQTGLAPGEPGDAAAAAALAGAVPGVRGACELYRYPEPLAPETAAARAGLAPPQLGQLADRVLEYAARHELTLVEGAGGVLVRLGPELTVLDLAVELAARGAAVQAVVVTRSGLGTLSDTELVVDRIRAAGIPVPGLVLGAHPTEPDLATRCNLADLPRLTGVPVVAALPAGVGELDPADFAAGALEWVDPGHAASMCRGQPLI